MSRDDGGRNQVRVGGKAKSECGKRGGEGGATRQSNRPGSEGRVSKRGRRQG